MPLRIGILGSGLMINTGILIHNRRGRLTERTALLGASLTPWPALSVRYHIPPFGSGSYHSFDTNEPPSGPHPCEVQMFDVVSNQFETVRLIKEWRPVGLARLG